MTPRAEPVLTQGGLFEQTWYRFTRRCYTPNIKALCLQRRRFSKILQFFSICLQWQPELWMELNSLNKFCRASPKEHPCQLALWFRRCLKKLLTDDGQRAITIAHSEHFVLRWAKQIVEKENAGNQYLFVLLHYFEIFQWEILSYKLLLLCCIQILSILTIKIFLFGSVLQPFHLSSFRTFNADQSKIAIYGRGSSTQLSNFLYRT